MALIARPHIPRILSGARRLVQVMDAMTSNTVCMRTPPRRLDRAGDGDGDVAMWFERAQQGDPVAIDGLLRSVAPTAQRFAARSCDSDRDAEDAAQEALTALVRRVGALRAAETVTSWLFVTIRNACRRRPAGVVLVPVGDLPETSDGDDSARVVDRVVVADALAALPARHREVLVYVDLFGLSLDEAADRLDVGVAATKSRLHRARRAIATALEDTRSGQL